MSICQQFKIIYLALSLLPFVESASSSVPLTVGNLAYASPFNLTATIFATYCNVKGEPVGLFAKPEISTNFSNI
jgi:hypothetical protein